jgi:hypothetical protein
MQKRSSVLPAPHPLAAREDVPGVGDHAVAPVAAAHDVLGRGMVDDLHKVVAGGNDDGIPRLFVPGAGVDVVAPAPPFRLAMALRP